MTGLLRSTAFRVAIVFALALVATTGVVFALVAWRFYVSDLATVENVLRNEVDKAADEPLDRLRRQLDLRLTQDLRHLDYVGLFAPDGRRLFGNIEPGFAVTPDGAPHLAAPPSLQSDEPGYGKAVFVARRRPDGVLLVLGRSLATFEELEAAMRGGFAAALLPVVLMALVIGTVVSRRAFRRIAEIEGAIDRVMAGELAERLPTRGTSDDIDALVRAVNLMLDEFGRLMTQMQSVGENIAHDLRAPLAVMRTRLERGLAGTSESELRDLCASALDDLERAMTIVTALLRISALEGGVRRGGFGSVDLVEVGHDAFELFQALAEAKGIGMTLEVERPVVVSGDGDLLREALANIVDNAIKYTPAGGRITIRCGGPGDTLIAVADTGPGIAVGERERIMRRFYRSAGTAHLAPGNGLGLSMAATIVDLHGLDLDVSDNRPGAIFGLRHRDRGKRRS